MVLETNLLKDYLKELDSRIKEREQHITTVVVDDYAEHVGYLNGLRVAKEEFTRLKEAYFPST